MAANVEAMVREGINAVKAGNKEEGRALLMKAVELDPYNEEGWLWLSGVVESPEDQRTCLENVLSINPNNDRARQGVAYLSGTPPSSSPSSMPPAPSPSSAPHSPTSVEWDMPAAETSSASTSWRPANEPSADEYDDWVSGLNLQTAQDPSGGSSSPFSVPAFATGSPFVGDDDDPDEDLFAGGPFSSAPIVEEAPPAPEPPAPSFSFQRAPTFSSSPKSPTPEASAAAPAPQRSRWRREKKQKQPVDAFPAELKEVDDFFKDLGTPEKAPAPEEEESELFGYIPKSVKATRLPGTRERTPILLVLAALLLIILNLGVATLLAMRFLTPV
jgi:hypothetical protein